MEILGVTFDVKLTFKCHLKMVAKSASPIIGIIKGAWRSFDCPAFPR